MHLKNNKIKIKPPVYKKSYKKSKRKREIPEYEEDLSNLLKRIKLRDIFDYDEAKKVEHERIVPSIAPDISRSLINTSSNAHKQSKGFPTKGFNKNNNPLCKKSLPYFFTNQNEAFCNSLFIDKNVKSSTSCISYATKSLCASENLNSLYIGGNKFSMSPSEECDQKKILYINDINPSEAIVSSASLKENKFDSLNSEISGNVNDGNSKLLNCAKENAHCIDLKKHESFKLPFFSINFKEKDLSIVDDNSKFVGTKYNEASTNCQDSEANEKIETRPKNEVCNEYSVKNLNANSEIIKTIKDLFLLETKIKQCQGLLRNFGVNSKPRINFSNLKLKSTKLMKTYKCLTVQNKSLRRQTEMNKKRFRLRNEEDQTKNHMGSKNNFFPLSPPALLEKNCRKRHCKPNSKFFYDTRFQIKRRKERNEEMMNSEIRILSNRSTRIKHVDNSAINSEMRNEKEEYTQSKNALQYYNSKRKFNGNEIDNITFKIENIPQQTSHDVSDTKINKILSNVPSVENISNVSSPDDKWNNFALVKHLNFESNDKKYFMNSRFVPSEKHKSHKESYFVHINQHETKLLLVLLTRNSFEKLYFMGLENINASFCKIFTCIEPNLNLTNINKYHSYQISCSFYFSKCESFRSSADSNFISDDSKHDEIVTDYQDPADEIQPVTNSCDKCVVQDLDAASGINKTIIDLLLLERKIKQCKQSLQKFDVRSDPFDRFKKIKSRSSKLIKTYKILQYKRNKLKKLNKKSKKVSCASKTVVSNENALYLNNEASTVFSLNSQKLDHSQKLQANSKISDNYKKDSQNKQKTLAYGEQRKHGRSILLDECISRVSTSMSHSHVIINEEKGLQTKKLSKNITHTKTEKDNKNKFYVTNEKFSKKNVKSQDPMDKEIYEILSQLPPIENILNSPESQDKSFIDAGVTETINYTTDGRSLVILPYTTL